MFNIESYVTPILLSYVDKYVQNFKPADAQVSLWGGGVSLHNLVLKTDVLQKELTLPFTLISGRIHELLIQVPWTKIMSEPIVVTIDTIECVLSIRPSVSPDEEPDPGIESQDAQVVEAPPGYMRALVRRIVNNIALRVQHLIVKYVQDDIVLSLTVKNVSIDSTDSNWTPSFADIDAADPVVRRVAILDDLTLCLDQADPDGKIRFYQEPLLYRCQLDFRILAKLVSANIRRASRINVELRSKRLAWAATNIQVLLIHRLINELPIPPPQKQKPRPSYNIPNASSPPSPSPSTSIGGDLEPHSSTASWTEWAWSWMPTLTDQEGETEVSSAPSLSCTPISFAAFLDEISLGVKCIEKLGSKNRPQNLFYFKAEYAALTISICKPLTLHLKVGVRVLELKSTGKCTCGVSHKSFGENESIIHTFREQSDTPKEWEWPEFDFSLENISSETNQGFNAENIEFDKEFGEQRLLVEFWRKLKPMIYVEYTHDRFRPADANPNEEPPVDFEYSDWREESHLFVLCQPILINVYIGLIHRMKTLYDIIKIMIPRPDHKEKVLKVLTIEECEALEDNVPQRTIQISCSDLRIQFYPFDLSLSVSTQQTEIVVDTIIRKSSIFINMPLYPDRVCSAASQLMTVVGPIWRASQLRICAVFQPIEVAICSPGDENRKHCARIGLRIVQHILLNKAMFADKTTIHFGYTIKIRELNVAGSKARLQAAFEVFKSLIKENSSKLLQHTSLVKDALADEDQIALDFSIEDLVFRGYFTDRTKTYLFIIQSARCTVFNRDGEVLQQAWVFSSPDVITNFPFIRMAGQWCSEDFLGALNYFILMTEDLAICIDPLFMLWFDYKPHVNDSGKVISDVNSARSMSLMSDTTLTDHQEPPVSSSSGRGNTSTGTEQVHVPNVGEPYPDVKKEPERKLSGWWRDGDSMCSLYNQYRYLLLSVDLSNISVYFSNTTVSAVDCETITLSMEQHASYNNDVVVLTVSNLVARSTTVTKHMWHEIQHYGPTFQKEYCEESLPWRVHIGSMTAFTIESNKDQPALKLKTRFATITRNIVDPFSTDIAISVDTKTLQYKEVRKEKEQGKNAQAEVKPLSEYDIRLKYFRGGVNFRPTTLMDFVRGPKSGLRSKDVLQVDPPKPKHKTGIKIHVEEGPLVSIGFNIYAQTPPIYARIEHHQIDTIFDAIHCITHLLKLCQKLNLVEAQTTEKINRSAARYETETEDITSMTDTTGSLTEIRTIFAKGHVGKSKLESFFYFQWVINDVTLRVSTADIKIVFKIEDVISNIRLQEYYSQLKVKIGDASIKHSERLPDGKWNTDFFGDQVLQVREPISHEDDSNFITVTLTRARISTLPKSWIEELEPKMFELQNDDVIWEVFVTLAPIDLAVRPKLIENFLLMSKDIKTRSNCSLVKGCYRSKNTPSLPFCHFLFGKMRVLLSLDCKGDANENADDLFIFSVTKALISPYPENPINRRTINTNSDISISEGNLCHGHQYEIMFKNLTIRSGHTKAMIQEIGSAKQMRGVINPAHQWNEKVLTAFYATALLPTDIILVLAPPLYINDHLYNGPAIEINVVADCTADINPQQIYLGMELIDQFRKTTAKANHGHILNPTEEVLKCSYTSTKFPLDESYLNSYTVIEAETIIDSTTSQRSGRGGTDSGVDVGIGTTAATRKPHSFECQNIKNKLTDPKVNPMNYIEVFFTMGLIEITLYKLKEEPKSNPPEEEVPAESDLENSERERTIHINEEKADRVHNKTSEYRLNITSDIVEEKREKILLISVALHQPNFYYWSKRNQRHIQMSLFNMAIYLGAGRYEVGNVPILSTTTGVTDPITGIRPALVTVKMVLSSVTSFQSIISNGISSTGSLSIDMERPLLLTLSAKNLTALKVLTDNINFSFMSPKAESKRATHHNVPFLYKVRQLLINHRMDTVILNTSQIGVRCMYGTAGFDNASVQIAYGFRPEKLVARCLINALVASVGATKGAKRYPLLMPLKIGVHIEALWEAWRRAESGLRPNVPAINVCLDVDNVFVDIRPTDFHAFNIMYHDIIEIYREYKSIRSRPSPTTAGPQDKPCEDCYMPQTSTLLRQHPSPTTEATPNDKPCEACYLPQTPIGKDSFTCTTGKDQSHYYKDDLRSGAFKIVQGAQIPMAYQVTLYNDVVSWRYPHPRAITKLVAFPLPRHNKEIDCVLEFYNSIVEMWLPYTYFKLPTIEPREIKFGHEPPELIFESMWRYRKLMPNEEIKPYEFCMKRFEPTTNPLDTVIQTEPEILQSMLDVTAEELSGVFRVDSYFSPVLLPHVKIMTRICRIELYVYNSVAAYADVSSNVGSENQSSKLIAQSHRVLTITARDTLFNSYLDSPAGMLLLLRTTLSSDAFDSMSAAMEPMINKFRMQIGLSYCEGDLANLRVRMSDMYVGLQVMRIRTISDLVRNWTNAIKDVHENKMAEIKNEPTAVADYTQHCNGRVSLWIENHCLLPLRLSQDFSKEMRVINPGTKIAYRWYNPSLPKKLRFAFVRGLEDWTWSIGIPFNEGSYQARVKDTEQSDAAKIKLVYKDVYIHVKQKEGAKHMQLTGRLTLSNMLRFCLYYKVRGRSDGLKDWKTIASGTLEPESVGKSIICDANDDMTLKIKLLKQESGWSGDIPLKECPKPNVPWLVKVPSEGDMPYVSVWCRVVHARTDGRLSAVVWPFYVLRSHLPLDINVTVTTLSGPRSNFEEVTSSPPKVQPAPGRGAVTHLRAPGTTATQHSLTLQYQNIDAQVTREEVPMHYGATNTSVFETNALVHNIEQINDQLNDWLNTSRAKVNTPWPYSVVRSHWPGKWRPVLMQAQCEIFVHYQAVRVGGGCSLEVHLCPMILLCNAAPIALTLRAYDATALCKVEPGQATAPSSVILERPFFISEAEGRDTFVSGQLELTHADPGIYGVVPPMKVAVDHCTEFAITSSRKVALLSLFYEIKENINVFGISSTYILYNKMDFDIMVSGIAVPNSEKNVTLHPTKFKLVRAAYKGTRDAGIPLPRFYLHSRWGNNESKPQWRQYLCVALAINTSSNPTFNEMTPLTPVPLELGKPPLRRGFNLYTIFNKSVPMVLIQQKHEGRWILTIAKDPCPQFIVRNCTQYDMIIAEGDPHSDVNAAKVECPGVEWHSIVEAGGFAHYSCPSYCASLSSTPNDKADPVTITVARPEDDEQLKWCTPVAVQDGEHYIPSPVKLKIHIRLFPHSSLLELREVEDNDVSASAIRERLAESNLGETDTVIEEPCVKCMPELGNSTTVEESLVNAQLQKDTDSTNADETPKKLTKRGKGGKTPSSIPESEHGTTVNESLVNAQPEKDIDSTNADETLEKPRKRLKLTFDLTPTIIPESEHGTTDNESLVNAQPEKDIASTNADETLEKLTKRVKLAFDLTPSSMPESEQRTTDNESLVNAQLQKDIDSTNADETSEKLTERVRWSFNLSPFLVPESEQRTTDNESLVNAQPQKDVDSTNADETTEKSTKRVRWSFDLSPSAEPTGLHFMCAIESLTVEMGTADELPLIALHVSRTAIVLSSAGNERSKVTNVTLSSEDVQVDNFQHVSGEFDFAVVASTITKSPAVPHRWPALATIFSDDNYFAPCCSDRVHVKLTIDTWTVAGYEFQALTEFHTRLGPLALYIEDLYIKKILELFHNAVPPGATDAATRQQAALRALQKPIYFRNFNIDEMDLTITLHTAVRMYIAVDHSPLHLPAFSIQHTMTSKERLVHSITVHFLSAIVLGAGWVVGGLELLGAPGALASRVGNATGGITGVAFTTVAALVRSLSAFAGSVARNLDLLAGDEEHAQRAAVARRQSPENLIDALAIGIANFGINILGAVGGLAHHPLVGVAVGEAGGVTALRRSLIGALTKPLSATADLVAFAGQGLLRQTGWDHVPQTLPRHGRRRKAAAGWRRDSVRWSFRLPEAIAGFEVRLNNIWHALILMPKHLVLCDRETEEIVESIDLRDCFLKPFSPTLIEVCVSNQRSKKNDQGGGVASDYQMNAMAMARVAMYTGAEVEVEVATAGGPCADRILSFEPIKNQANALYAALEAAIHNISDTHFALFTDLDDAIE